jgi:hypothetical protein
MKLSRERAERYLFCVLVSPLYRKELNPIICFPFISVGAGGHKTAFKSLFFYPIQYLLGDAS